MIYGNKEGIRDSMLAKLGTLYDIEIPTEAVSYTHLDVYKRQHQGLCADREPAGLWRRDSDHPRCERRRLRHAGLCLSLIHI